MLVLVHCCILMLALPKVSIGQSPLESAVGVHAHKDISDHSIRCLTPLIEEYENNPESRSALGPILGINSIEELHQKHAGSAEIADYEEHLSESGRFLIRFKRTGTGAVSDVDNDENGIPDYVDSTAVYSDYSWDLLIDQLGFKNPIPDLEKPLIIRIDSLNRGVYGYYSHGSKTISVQNSYVGFPPNIDPYSQEFGALKVTIAHEFKHAIQFNTFQGLTGGWIELDATMAEEVVYPTVKDYLNYLTSTQNPSVSLNPQRTVAGNPAGYYHVTAGLFYQEKFGNDFWVKVWERLENGEATGIADYMHKAISLELLDRGHSPDAEFVNLYLWHYAAGETNSREDFGFKDRLFYPDIRISNTDLYRTFPYKSTTNTFNWKAAYVYEFYPDADLASDEDIMVGLFRSPKFQNFEGRIHVGLIAFYNNGSIDTTIIDLHEDTELISFYGSPLGFIGGHVDWNMDEIQKIGVVVANTTPPRQNQAQSALPKAQLVIGTTSNPSPNKFGKIISNEDALEEAHAEALLEQLVGISTAPSLNNPLDFIAADISANHTISTYDASLILQKKDNIITAYPADPQNSIFAPLSTWYTEFDTPIAAKSSNTVCFQSDCTQDFGIAEDPNITFVSVFGDPENPNNVSDDILRVKISVNTDLTFRSGLIEVNYVDTLLEFVDHEISNLNQNNIIFKRSTSNNNLKLAFASSEVIFDAESVLTLNFRPLKMDSTDVTLRLTKLELDEQVAATPNLSTSNKVKGNDGVSIDRPTESPISTALHAAYPNPFNPSTTIPFSISDRKAVSIQIFDITGRHISTISNDIYPPGQHAVRFNAIHLSSGIYIARMVVTDPTGISPAEMFIRRLTLIK